MSQTEKAEPMVYDNLTPLINTIDILLLCLTATKYVKAETVLTESQQVEPVFNERNAKIIENKIMDLVNRIEVL